MIFHDTVPPPTILVLRSFTSCPVLTAPSLPLEVHFFIGLCQWRYRHICIVLRLLHCTISLNTKVESTVTSGYVALFHPFLHTMHILNHSYLKQSLYTISLPVPLDPFTWFAYLYVVLRVAILAYYLLFSLLLVRSSMTILSILLTLTVVWPIDT